ncbi:hypothetical protein C2E20_0368 [Micractinium conductrix]|uniref:Uncharacterized protein n=1 Tax=Micractinium conductrix TaxID=554055 RepID=A0A2P6VQA2_9CHLO|nr:hypothetical protein C2E20_0368 [Micractinium conductrix]|eukprot:PSC76283.1 hypothetical protein C2E20_0368 [Micractinium conductrix]
MSGAAPAANRLRRHPSDGTPQMPVEAATAAPRGTSRLATTPSKIPVPAAPTRLPTPPPALDAGSRIPKPASGGAHLAAQRSAAKLKSQDLLGLLLRELQDGDEDLIQTARSSAGTGRPSLRRDSPLSRFQEETAQRDAQRLQQAGHTQQAGAQVGPAATQQQQHAAGLKAQTAAAAQPRQASERLLQAGGIGRMFRACFGR